MVKRVIPTLVYVTCILSCFYQMVRPERAHGFINLAFVIIIFLCGLIIYHMWKPYFKKERA